MRVCARVGRATESGGHRVGGRFRCGRHLSGGVEGVERFLRGLCEELRVAMMLCGAARVRDLRPSRTVLTGRLLEWTGQRGGREAR
jgi:isopentenyl diphosphate isomerase/L-lactate dehydrogenase-like FMN-dependent dehydrogenase